MIHAYPIQRAVLGGRGVDAYLAGVFSPTSLLPLAWLSDTGASAATWPDISGNGNDATQGTGGSQPAIVTNVLNGKQARRFDGGDFMDGNVVIGDTELTVFIVGSMNNTTDNFGRAVSLGLSGHADFDDGRYTAAILRDGGNEAIAAYRNNAELSINGVTYATPFIGACRYGQMNQRTYVNGSNVATANSFLFDISAYRIGAELSAGSPGGFWNGDLFEVLIFDYALTAAQMDQVGGYFATKYALTWTP